MDGNTYAIINGELYHFGVPGMKWGKRKARPVATGNGRLGRKSASTSSQSDSNPADEAARKEARKQKAVKAAKIGAAVAATALAAYGAYKVSQFVKDKKLENRLKKAAEFDKMIERRNQAYNAQANADWARVKELRSQTEHGRYQRGGNVWEW